MAEARRGRLCGGKGEGEGAARAEVRAAWRGPTEVRAVSGGGAEV